MGGTKLDLQAEIYRLKTAMACNTVGVPVFIALFSLPNKQSRVTYNCESFLMQWVDNSELVYYSGALLIGSSVDTDLVFKKTLNLIFS